MILEFQKSVEYFEKAKLARQLAYVGTQACAAALVDGLRSSVVHESAYESCSIRSNILEALGMIFDEEALFTIDARLLNSNSDVVFDQRRGLGDYIMDVDNWVLKEFGHSAWDSDVVWFRRVKNVPIVEPRANGTE